MRPQVSRTSFLADVSWGDQSALVSWGLQITAVPEPNTYALVIFGMVFAVVKLISLRLKPVRSTLRK